MTKKNENDSVISNIIEYTNDGRVHYYNRYATDDGEIYTTYDPFEPSKYPPLRKKDIEYLRALINAKSV